MPIHNWRMIMETSDLTHLYKVDGGQYTDRLIPIWDGLLQQHQDEFGISEDMASLWRLKIKIIKLNLKFLESNKSGGRRDYSILNLIKVAEAKLAEKLSGEGMKFGRMLILVSSKVTMYRINPKEFSVYEWGYALKELHNVSNTE